MTLPSATVSTATFAASIPTERDQAFVTGRITAAFTAGGERVLMIISKGWECCVCCYVCQYVLYKYNAHYPTLTPPHVLDGLWVHIHNK